jgi:hypothetical protein
MQHTIKSYRRLAGLACVAATLAIAGCNITDHKKSGSDSTATDSVKKDSAIVAKKDSDSTAVKKVDSAANPPSNLPKIDTAVKHRPIGRKT